MAKPVKKGKGVTDSDVGYLLKEYEALKSARSDEEREWKIQQKYFFPSNSSEIIKHKTDDDVEGNIYTSSPYFAVEAFASGIVTSTTPIGTKWINCFSSKKDIKESDAAVEWLAAASRGLLMSMRSSVSSFYSEIPGFVANWGVNGNAVFYSQYDVPTKKFIDRRLSIFSVHWSIDHFGRPEKFFRAFERNLNQLNGQFGIKNLHKKMQDELSKKGVVPDTKYKLVQIFLLNKWKDDSGAAEYKKKYISLTVDLENKHLIEAKGFTHLPIFIARMDVAPEYTFGLGIGAKSLPDAKMLNLQEFQTIEANQMVIKPPTFIWDERLRNTVGLFSGAINFGNAIGSRKMVEQLPPNINGVMLSQEQKTKKEQEIGNHFVFANNQKKSGVSPTEYYGEEQKSLRGIIDHLSRYEYEFLIPFIETRLATLEDNGLLEKRPDILKGVDIELAFNNKTALSINATKAQNINNWMMNIMQIANVDAEVLDKYDLDQVADEIGETYNIPQKFLRSKDEIKEIREGRQKAAQAQQSMSQAGQAADAMGKLGVSAEDILGGTSSE